MAQNPAPGQPITVALTNLNGGRDGTHCGLSLGGVNGMLGYIEYQSEPAAAAAAAVGDQKEKKKDQP